MPKLRWVCAVAAGVDKLLVEDLPATVPVSRIVDTEQADGIAQFVVLMALRHARALPMYEAQQRERRWRRSPVAAVRSRVLVLGTGAMGGVVARLLGAVGFQVQGWSRATSSCVRCR
jgi:phosphoglycerate dehydrogenase-like enzyme